MACGPTNNLPFMTHPTPGSIALDDANGVCGACRAATCCAVENAIYMNSYDVVRLATHLQMSVQDFMLTFTQDQFDDPTDEERRTRIDDPDDDTITYLRRRSNFGQSPCIFLEYQEDEHGLRRRCGVYAGRPVACREYFWSTCRERTTADIAVVHTAGYVALAKGEITIEQIEANVTQAIEAEGDDPTLRQTYDLAFWTEMQRAANWKTANVEGALDYSLVEYQDPLQDKIERMFDKWPLRLELQGDWRHMPVEPVTPERRHKFLQIATTAPTTEMFARGDFALAGGWRHAYVTTLPNSPLVPAAGVWQEKITGAAEVAMWKGYNALLQMTNRLIVAGELEADPFNLNIELLNFFLNVGTTDVTRGQTSRLAAVRMLAPFVTRSLRDPDMHPQEVLRRLYNLHAASTIFSCNNPTYNAAKDGFDVAASMQRIQSVAMPVEAIFEDGGTPDDDAWSEWFSAVMEPLHLIEVFPDMPEEWIGEALNRHLASAERLVAKGTLDNDQMWHLWNIVSHIGYASNGYSRYDSFFERAQLDRLLSLGRTLVSHLMANPDGPDVEMIAECVDAIYMPYSPDPKGEAHIEQVIQMLVSSQDDTGFWNSNPRQSENAEGDYMYRLMHSTWTCVDALRFYVNRQ